MPLNKEDLIKYKIERCNETINEAEEAIESKHFHLAVNRIYYSIFYIISALAIKDNFSTSKHNQQLGWFNKNYIKTNRVNKDLGKIYRNSFSKRLTGDYDDFIDFEEEKVRKDYEAMILLIKEIKKLL